MLRIVSETCAGFFPNPELSESFSGFSRKSVQDSVEILFKILSECDSGFYRNPVQDFVRIPDQDFVGTSVQDSFAILFKVLSESST